MQKFNVLFQMDPFDKLNKEIDSTCILAREALMRGHNVFTSQPNDIYFSVNKVSVNCSGILITNNYSLKTQKRKRTINLEDFDVVFVRQDPPFNMDYISNTYIHDLISPKKVPFFINSPNGIRNFTEKLFPLLFSEIIPETAIMNCEQEILRFISNYESVVIKPLYEKGGNGVDLIKRDDHDKLEKIKKLTKNFKQRIVIQEFIKNVSKGDKRVLLVDGNPVGAINRVPQKNEFKANLHLGAKAKKTLLSRSEKKICKILKPYLIKNGLFFVGIDIIDEKLTEINVTSPTGIHHLNLLDNKRIESTMWDIIQSRVTN